jgi:antitoxin component YwqK of YwqJK toxin-antitoxin module
MSVTTATDSIGTVHWYQNGRLHRDNDLPAIECADGTKYWYQNGELI